MRRVFTGVLLLCAVALAWSQGQQLRNNDVIISAEQEEFIRRSQDAYRHGDHGEALQWASRAVVADQTNYVGYAHRAQLNDAMRRFDAAVVDYSSAYQYNPRNIHLLRMRAQAHFRAGRVLDAIKDWESYRDREPQPEKTLKMFQLGIAYAVAGQYEDGRKLFGWFNTVESEDVEAAAWHYLCVARGADADGVAKARNSLLEVDNDKRLPMMQINELLKGNIGPSDVFAAAKSGDPSESELKQRLFYSHLYVGVYYLADGRNWLARGHLSRAANTWQPDAVMDQTLNYMADVSRVQDRQLQKLVDETTATEIAATSEHKWADNLTKVAWVFAGMFLVYLIVRVQPLIRPKKNKLIPIGTFDELPEEEVEEDLTEELVAVGAEEDDDVVIGKSSTTEDG